MNWKSVLYEYVYHRNRMETDFRLLPLRPYVADEEYLDLQNSRLQRIEQLRGERPLSPLRRETRLRVEHVREWEGGVAVEIALDQQLDYEHGTRVYQEQKIERERVLLSRQGGSWQIQSIVPDTSENGYNAADLVMEAASSGDHEPEKALGYASNANTGTGLDPDRDPTFVPLSKASPTPAVGQVKPYPFPPMWDKYPSSPLTSSQIYTPGGGVVRSTGYNRKRAGEYADLWWNSYNPQYLGFEVDCSNYVSQCLFAGGAPMNYTGKRGSGWWYHGQSSKRELWSYSWAVADSLRRYLASSRSHLRAEVVNSPSKLQVGDVISYSWKGNGHYGHSTVVSAIAEDGMPLVNAHTVNSRHRYWDYRDSYAWTKNTEYRFFHIFDSFS